MGRFVANSRRGKMKTILALALAALAAAEPEAKPEADAYYGYGYGLGDYYGGYRTYGLGYGHGLYYGKREAEAEPYYGYAAHAVPPVVSTYAAAPVVSHAVAPSPCPMPSMPSLPSSPATPRSPPPPLSPPLALLPPPSPLSEVPTPVLDVTSPTPLEPSMLPRGRPRLTPTTTEDTRTWIRTRLQELRIRSRIRPWILLGLDSARTSYILMQPFCRHSVPGLGREGFQTCFKYKIWNSCISPDL